MPFGIENVTSVTMQNLTDIGTNVSDYTNFAINVNQGIYGGWLYFIILWVVGVVLYLKFQQSQDQPLNNMMYSASILAIASLFIRAIEVTQFGIVQGLLTDKQLWIFPLIAVSLAAIIWAIKDR